MSFLSEHNARAPPKPTKVCDKPPPDDCAASSAQPVVNALQHALSGTPQLLRRVVRYVRAASRPDGRVGDACKDKKRLVRRFESDYFIKLFQLRPLCSFYYDV